MPVKKSKYPRQCPNPECNKIFSSSAGFYYHVRTKHNNGKNANLRCPIDGCVKMFRSVPGLEYHLKRHTEGLIKSSDGRILDCVNVKDAKREALTKRKNSSLRAEQATTIAAKNIKGEEHIMPFPPSSSADQGSM